ncbi:transcription termination factor ixodes scapularis transcription termination factor [Elysia marginata]|uniref:Transcription termination factor ixodes scapularis transcription termination factor n=1 Tax=Elysia marginata TaxID=1093978 RepID=A0AAV4F855_9GAST|nr:transcription termination factor ixodes scapularis transcription termination factor [Elysia marginata]
MPISASKLSSSAENPVNCHAHSWLKHYSQSRAVSRGLEKQGFSSVSADNLLSKAHIKSLAGTLSCSSREIISLIRDHPFLIHMDLNLLERKINLLLSYGLSVNFIRENLRIVYQTSEKVIEDRLKLLQDSGLLHSQHLETDLVAHLLESNSSGFSKSLQYRYDQRDALEGCPDQLSYLQVRLGCSEEKARSLLCSYPLIRRASNVKLKTLLDFLLIEADRSPEFIIKHRKLLAFSVSRLRQRWSVMQKAGLESEGAIVFVWCMPQKQFEKQYQEYLEVLNSSSSAQS